MNKETIPKNDKNQPHGHWVRYYDDGKFWGEATYHNGFPFGFHVYHSSDSRYIRKTYWIR